MHDSEIGMPPQLPFHAEHGSTNDLGYTKRSSVALRLKVVKAVLIDDRLQVSHAHNVRFNVLPSRLPVSSRARRVVVVVLVVLNRPVAFEQALLGPVAESKAAPFARRTGGALLHRGFVRADTFDVGLGRLILAGAVVIDVRVKEQFGRKRDEVAR